MVGLPKYESYKDSGVEWLGEIPSHWEVLRAKCVFREVSEKNYPKAQLLSVTQNQGVIPRDELEQRVVMPIGQLQTFKLVRKDDFVVSLRSFQGGIEYSEYTGLVSPAYTVLRKQRNINSNYLKWLLKSSEFISELNISVTGIRQGKNISFQDFCFSFLPIPEIEEQKRISKFLDRKTAEIDQAIAQKQRLIELLQEQKAILINQAVTKGLDPNVPMCDRGVEWLGEIPAHWKLSQLKYCCEIIKDGLHITPAKHDEGINFISTQHIRNRKIAIDKATYISENAYKLGHPRVKPEVGDVLVTLVGSIGFAALVAREHMPLSCTRHVGYVRCKPNQLAQEYLIDYTESHIFKYFVEENVSQTAQPSIYLATLASHRLPLPPLDEQIEISRWLSKVIKPYLEAIDTALQKISIFQEFKQVYIAEAVTGKIKV